MKRFIPAFGATFLVLAVHAFALACDGYHRWMWFDIPMHFFGGYAMGLLGLAILSWVRSRVDVKPRSQPRARLAMLLLEGMFVIGFAIMIGVGWEWFEFLVDTLATSFVQTYGVAQMGLADTMDDLFNDTLGALTAWILWRSRI